MFMNHKYALSDFLAKVPEKNLLVIGPDVQVDINTGFMALRNNAKAAALMQRVWDCGATQRLKRHWGHEQQCLSYLMETDKSVRHQVYVAAEDSPGIRLFAEDITKPGWWRPGMLVAHAAGWKGECVWIVALVICL